MLDAPPSFLCADRGELVMRRGFAESGKCVTLNA